MDVKEQLVKDINTIIVDKFLVDTEQISEDTKLKLQDDLGLDSLDRLELCMEIEKHYDIAINDDHTEEWGKMTVIQVAESIIHLIQ
jgi:acyl carrier protein